jgi:DNA helicase MCM8
MKQSLLETFEDEFGNIDFRKSTGMSKSKEIKRFIQKLQKLSEQNCKSLWNTDELQQIAQEINLNYGSSFTDFLSNINQAGYLISKGSKQYKLCLS